MRAEGLDILKVEIKLICEITRRLYDDERYILVLYKESVYFYLQ